MFQGVNHKGRRGKSNDLSHEASHRATPRKSKCEESAEVIVPGNREGPNNPICRFECMFRAGVRHLGFTNLGVSLVKNIRNIGTNPTWMRKGEGQNRRPCWVCSRIEPPIAERHDGWCERRRKWKRTFHFLAYSIRLENFKDFEDSRGKRNPKPIYC